MKMLLASGNQVTINPKQAARFHRSYTIAQTGCWEWAKTLNEDGYGRFWIGKRGVSAHRLAYFLAHGQPPVSADIDHRCRNRKCVNPAHLRPLTRKMNILIGEGMAARNAAKTHCKRNHEFTPANTILRKTGRTCRTCLRASQLAYYHRTKAAA